MPEVQTTGAFRWVQAQGIRLLQCLPLLPYAAHAFTSRDVRLREDDEEWSLVARAVGVEASRVRLLRQVHGVAVAVVNRESGQWAHPEADVIVSGDPESAVAVRVADCAPILLADTRLGVVAAAHAGWRGTAAGAGQAAVSALGEHFGSKARDLIAAIGPCLGACCGEVGPEVVEAFRAAGHSTRDVSRWFEPGAGDRHLLHLALANRDQLVARGVPAPAIHDASLCTKSHPALFHSYRGEGKSAGRMAAVIRPQASR